MDSWLRIAVFAIILLSFLRRIMKMKNQGAPRLPGQQSKVPSTITPTLGRPRSGKKNDFRDVPPPPENPELG
ncbi:MAG: hypothetical protein WAK13_05880 [Terriglobales bacterium]